MFRVFFLIVIFLSLNLFADVAKVVALTGESLLIREGNTLVLKKESIIFKNDEIRTNAKSKVQLFFKDETIITIGRNSSFQVYDYIFDKDNSADNLDFSMFKGVFKIISGAIGKINPENFKLRTKSATIGIRGTQIHLDLNEEREVISCTEGTIIITLISSKEEIVLNAGESIVIDIKSKQIKKINNAKAVNIYSFDEIKNVKIDDTYDEWIKEKESISYAVEDAFSKGHKVDYTVTTLEGTIDEQTDGLTSFDTSNATFDLSIDFGKQRDDNPVEGLISIDTATQTSKTQNLLGNINNLNKIDLTYEVKESGVFVTKDATGNLEFENNNLDVKGKDIEVRSYIQNEKIIIENVEFEVKQ
jgi:hypothetical protein